MCRGMQSKTDTKVEPGGGGYFGGIVVAVRSDKRHALSLLFRHSIMTVVDVCWVFPPYFMQWQRLAACFWSPALPRPPREPHHQR